MTAVRDALQGIMECERALRQGGPAPEDLDGLAGALQEAVDLASYALLVVSCEPISDSDVEHLELVESVARWLHDEMNDAEACFEGTWPEHPGDTGQSESAFIKVVPGDVQARFRERARRLCLLLASHVGGTGALKCASCGADLHTNCPACQKAWES